MQKKSLTKFDLITVYEYLKKFRIEFLCERVSCEANGSWIYVWDGLEMKILYELYQRFGIDYNEISKTFNLKFRRKGKISFADRSTEAL